MTHPETSEPDARTTAPRHVMHIGMHKSATTAIQFAAAAARARLAEHGVTYPSGMTQHSRPTAYLWDERPRVANGAAAEARWLSFAEQLAEAPGRTFISAEHLATARPERIRGAAARLDGDIHAVITVRNFASMLPSIWQQYVKERRTVAYDTWLEDIFTAPPASATTPNFWVRHDLGGLVSRWAEALPAGRVTVVVLDRARPELVYRAFESILGVPEGTLQPQRLDPRKANRGLSLQEVELLRRVNEGLLRHEWPSPRYLDLVRGGLVAGLQRVHAPDPSEGVLALPDRWLDPACDAAARGVAAVRAAGVEVIGDLDEFSRRPTPRGDVPTTARVASPDVLGVALAGIASAANGDGAGFRGAAAGEAARIIAHAPAADTTAVGPVVGAAPRRVRVLGGADVASAARSAGAAAPNAQALAEAALHHALVDALVPGAAARPTAAPTARLSGSPSEYVTASWQAAWEPAQVLASFDDVDAPLDVTIELPDLPDMISAAWERALILDSVDDFAAWGAWAARPDAWGAWGALPDPGATADLVEAVAKDPRVSPEGITLRVASRTVRRLAPEEHATFAAAARVWQGRRTEVFGLAAIMLLGAAPALRAAAPAVASPDVVSTRLLTRYSRARAAAAERIVSAVGAASRDVASAWAGQHDATLASVADPAPSLLDTEQAAQACLGAISMAMGRGRCFDPGVSERWGGASGTAAVPTVDVDLPAIGPEPRTRGARGLRRK